METSVHKFDLKAFKRKPRASAVSLGSLAPENGRKVRRSWPEPTENERVQSLPLRQFYKGLKGKTNLGDMAWKQACTNLI